MTPLKIVEFVEIDDRRDWMDGAPRANPLGVDIGFTLRDSFPTDTSGRDPRLWPTQPLRLPDFPRAKPLLASFREAEGHETALAAYYRDSAALMRSYGDVSETLYWLQLELTGGLPGTDIGFSWWDTLSDMRPLFDWIGGAGDGETFDDLDQGWRVQAVRRGEELFFRHSGFDQGGEYGKLRTSRAVCIAAANDTWARTVRIVQALRRELGIDPWT